MERTRFIEDYEIGESRTTFGRTITETDFVVHAGHTGDFFPHHMDAVFMAESEFKGRIAHGTLVFSIGIGLTASEVNPVAFSYGYDRLRFIRPVFIGDTIRTRLTNARIEDDPKRPNSARLFEKVEVLNQNDETVLACEHIYIVERRPQNG